jgi:hypothetical protein
MPTLTLTLNRNVRTEPVRYETRRLINAGFTGRDRAAIEPHIEELRHPGVPYPDETPVFYPKMASRITTADEVEVIGPDISGEAEFVLLLDAGRAIENQVFLASSNCGGANLGRQFAGHSMVVDPWASSSPAAATRSAWSRPTSTWRPSPARGACSPPSPTAGCPSDGSRFLARPARLSRRGSRAIRVD